MRILSVDPSNMGGGDPLGVILLESKVPDLHIIGAKYWNNADFTEVETEIANIYEQKKCNLLVMEKNSMGKRIGHSFTHEYNLPVFMVHTSNTLKNTNAGVMDKMEQANWLIKMQQNGNLVWAEATTDYMKELRRQWSIFGEYKKGKLAAPGGEHDDLMMALMVGTYVLRMREFQGTLKFLSLKDDLEEDTLSILNKEKKDGKTGLSWNQR